MKKSSHTMGRNIGIYVLGLLVFLAISCSQDVLAAAVDDVTLATTPTATAVNGVTLNVQAANTTANKLLYNKIFYKTALPTVTAPLLWAEKAVYNGSSTADAEIKITATTKLAGDLIIKVDVLSATSPSALSILDVTTFWLKYSGTGPFESPVVAMVPSASLDKSSLTSLRLARVTATTTTINLMDFFTKFRSPSLHVIFTAVLVDDTTDGLTGLNPNPQVKGVDVQSIFFNYIDTTAVAWEDERSLWLDLIQAAPAVP